MAVAERSITISGSGRDLNYEARRAEAGLRLAVAAIKTPALLGEVHDQIIHGNRMIGTEQLGMLTSYRSLRSAGNHEGLRSLAEKSIGWILDYLDYQYKGSERVRREEAIEVNPFLRMHAERTVEELRRVRMLG